MKKIDFNNLYEKFYKKLPLLISVIFCVLIGFIGLLDVLVNTSLLAESYHGILMIVVGNVAYTSGILAFLIWAFLSALAIPLYFVSAIIISQKIKVVNELEKLNDVKLGNTEKNADELIVNADD